MAKSRVWVLDTETKGTGAEMVPLDKVLTRPSPSPEPFTAPPRPQPRPQPAPAPRRPRRFRVVDVMTRQLLADGTGIHATLAALGEVRRSVDVNVFVWEPEGERWRLLTLGEQQQLWRRRRSDGVRPAPPANSRRRAGTG
jgi:hypothetical protein